MRTTFTTEAGTAGDDPRWTSLVATLGLIDAQHGLNQGRVQAAFARLPAGQRRDIAEAAAAAGLATRALLRVQRAAERGGVAACLASGQAEPRVSGEDWLCPRGRELLPDPAVARRWALGGAATGSTQGLVVADYIPARGVGGPVEFDAGRPCPRRVAALGSVEGHRGLDVLLARSCPDARDEAIAQLRIATEAGNASAAAQLGDLLAEAGGDPPAMEAACEAWALAAERGQAGAARRLVRHLIDGPASSADPVRAERLLHRAAQAGDLAAMVEFADLHRAGRHPAAVPKAAA